MAAREESVTDPSWASNECLRQDDNNSLKLEQVCHLLRKGFNKSIPKPHGTGHKPVPA
jgi:hypothetical protein